jgi:hypothetical protein
MGCNSGVKGEQNGLVFERHGKQVRVGHLLCANSSNAVKKVLKQVMAWIPNRYGGTSP